MPIHELSRNRRIGVLLICCMSLFIVGLDITVVNVALPSIGQELDASISGLQWTVGAYTVVMASLLHVRGLDGRPARPQAHRSSSVSAVFSVASLLCSLAPSVELLVAFRVLQGVGASMLNPVAMSIITNTFTDPRERAQAVGVWGAVFGISHGARADRGRHARLLGRLAVDLLDQHSRRARRDPPDAPLHPRVEGAEAAPVRSRRPGRW